MLNDQFSMFNAHLWEHESIRQASVSKGNSGSWILIPPCIAVSLKAECFGHPIEN